MIEQIAFGSQPVHLQLNVHQSKGKFLRRMSTWCSKTLDAWIQGKDTQSGNSFEEEVIRLKTLLDAERAKFNKENQRANDFQEELHNAKLRDLTIVCTLPFNFSSRWIQLFFIFYLI